ncbi:MAG: histidinol-phosphate transaminase [Gammaproteobacteria bacterium]|nr:histidinol-phosphate transaminase [Gammaproteobacteria bacterium]
MRKFWSPAFQDLRPYVAGEQLAIPDLIKLNTNENPYPPSPAALAAIRTAANADLRLYPDPEGLALRRALAKRHGLSTDQIFVGNGSDEVLALAFLALLRQPRPILFPDITYSFYPVYCQLYGIGYINPPVDADYRIRTEDYRHDNGGIVLAHPNAPTGRALELPNLRALLEYNTGSAVIVDEAYVDFGADSVVSWIREFPQLLVIQTLSKSRALAGLRVGFAFGDSNLIEALRTAKDSFNSYPLDRLALAGAVAAIEDEPYFERMRHHVMESRTRLTRGLEQMGFAVIPSHANFVFATHPRYDAAKLQAELRQRNVLVRHFAKPRIDQHLRISVGTDTECDILLARLSEILGESAVSR